MKPIVMLGLGAAAGVGGLLLYRKFFPAAGQPSVRAAPAVVAHEAIGPGSLASVATLQHTIVPTSPIITLPGFRLPNGGATIIGRPVGSPDSAPPRTSQPAPSSSRPAASARSSRPAKRPAPLRSVPSLKPIPVASKSMPTGGATTIAKPVGAPRI